MSGRQAGVQSGLSSRDHQVGVGGGGRRGMEAHYKGRLGSGLHGGRQTASPRFLA